MKKTLTLILGLATFIISTQSCSKEKTTDLDNSLYSNATTLADFKYYNGTPSITKSLGNSPHGYERIRFNTIAQGALDSSGKLPTGKSFPLGSMIVKEIYSSTSGSINLYAVMKKFASNNSNGNNYYWAEFNTDGSVKHSTSRNGDGCISCHSSGSNRDLIRIFDLK